MGIVKDLMEMQDGNDGGFCAQKMWRANLV